MPHSAESTRLLPYTPLVRRMANIINWRTPANIEFDDLYQAGMLAVHISLDRYVPTKGATIETYLTHCIRGAMLDEIRAQDYLSRGARNKKDFVEVMHIHIDLDDPEEGPSNDMYITTTLEQEPPGEYALKQQVQLVIKAVGLLDQNERDLMNMIYEEELMHEDIAKKLHVCTSRVSQRKNEIIAKLAKLVRRR